MKEDAEYTRDELSSGLAEAEQAADELMTVYESEGMYDADQARAWQNRIRAAREELEAGSGLPYETRKDLVEAISGLQEYTRAELERERAYIRREGEDGEPALADIAAARDAEDALEKLDTAAYVVRHLVEDDLAEDLDVEEEKRDQEHASA